MNDPQITLNVLEKIGSAREYWVIKVGQGFSSGTRYFLGVGWEVQSQSIFSTRDSSLLAHAGLCSELGQERTNL